MTSQIRLVWTLFIIILLTVAISCTNDMTVGSSLGKPDNSAKITSLQTVIDNAQPNSTIDLSLYKDIPNFDYEADVNQTVTIKNGELNNAMLTVVSDNVKLTNIQNVSVTASDSLSNGSLKISGSSLSSLNILGGGANSIYLQNGSVVTGQTILNKSVSDSNDEFVRLVLDNSVTVHNLVVKQSSLLDADTVVAAANLQNVTFNIDNSDDKAALAINPNITFNRDSSLACVTFINSDESADLMKIFVRRNDESSVITKRFFVAAFERLVHSLDKDTKTAMFMQLIDILEVPIDNDICLAIEGLELDNGDDSSESVSNGSSENDDSSSESSSSSSIEFGDSSSESVLSSSSENDDSSSESVSSSSSEFGNSSSESVSSSSSEVGDSSSESVSSSSCEAGDSSSSSDSSSASSSSAGDNSSSSSSSESDPVDPITYTVRFHIGAGSSTDNPVEQTMTYGESVTLTPNTFSVANWVFMGWSTQCQSELGDTVTIDYTDGQSVSNLTDVENGIVDLYAVWDRAKIVYSDKSASKIYNSEKTAIGVALEYNDNGDPTKILCYLTSQCYWSLLKVDTDADDEDDGYANTQVIKNLLTYASYSAFVAIDTISNKIPIGINWYIPAKNELLSMQKNIAMIDAALADIPSLIPITGFEVKTLSETLSYWSSTEASANNAWKVNVVDGTVEESNKTTTLCYIRPVAVLDQ